MDRPMGGDLDDRIAAMDIDVIIPELRGTGVASPSLACPEMEGHATLWGAAAACP
jgi:hypothetical protein